MARKFTPAEANSALQQVRPVAERVVALTARLDELAGERRSLADGASGNGGAPREDAIRGTEFTAAATELQACLNDLAELGVEVRDAATGLLDFPSLREGEDVLLCWRVGEDAVEWWHDRSSGYSGRRAIDWSGDDE